MAQCFFVYGWQKEMLWVDGSSSYSSYSMDPSSRKVAWAFTAEEATTIDRVGFRYTQKFGSVTPTYRIGIVNFANGTFGTSYLNNAYGTFTPPTGSSWDATYRTITLNNSYTCYQGQPLGIMLELDSGGSASNFSSITLGNNAPVLGRVFPAAYFYNGTSWAQSTATPVYSYGNSSKMYGNGWTAISSRGTSSGKVGTILNVPSGVCNSYKVGAVQLLTATTDASGDTYYIRIWDSSENILQSLTFNTGHQANATNNSYHQFWFDKASLATLYPNTNYYIGIEYVSGTEIVLRTITFNSANELQGNNRNNLILRYGSTISTGTSVDTQNPCIYPIITEIN